MAAPRTLTSTASMLMGMRVEDVHGSVLGSVAEFVVALGRDAQHVDVLLLHCPGQSKKKRKALPLAEVVLPEGDFKRLVATAGPRSMKPQDETLLLDRDLLDQQIIDVDGRKVVRVNDVNLMWEIGNGDGPATQLRITDVEVGMRGVMTRLLKGLPSSVVVGVAAQFKSRIIPWNCVDLIERDPARRVKLKIGQDRLAKMHPSDIAAILEELAPAEREAIFTSLPEETAAETLEEVAPKLQRELVEGLGSEHAADIIEEMDPAAAADLLAELSDEASDAILEEMEPEERQDVEDLLVHAENTAAASMTTDFVSAATHATVAEGIAALRDFDGDPETITEIYLAGDDGKWTDVVALARLLLASGETKLTELSEGHRVSCPLHATDGEVAALFDKYNLRSLPVLDSQGRVAGVIHAEQVIAQLMEN